MLLGCRDSMQLCAGRKCLRGGVEMLWGAGTPAPHAQGHAPEASRAHELLLTWTLHSAPSLRISSLRSRTCYRR